MNWCSWFLNNKVIHFTNKTYIMFSLPRQDKCLHSNTELLRHQCETYPQSSSWNTSSGNFSQFQFRLCKLESEFSSSQIVCDQFAQNFGVVMNVGLVTKFPRISNQLTVENLKLCSRLTIKCRFRCCIIQGSK